MTLNPDIGHMITAVVTACDAFGDCNPATATGSYQVVCSVTNSVLPAVTPTGYGPPGGTVQTSQGTWSTTCQGAHPNAPTLSYAYTWSNGKTTQSFQTGSSDVGHTLTASVKATGTWTWSGGSKTETLTKASTGGRTVCGLTMNTAPVLTPSGNGTVSTPLQTTNGSWSLNPSSCPGATSFSYEWDYASSSSGPWLPIPGAPNASSYTPSLLYVGDYMRAVVTASNPDTLSSTVASSGIFYLAPAPSNTAPPSISGTTSVGSDLTGSDGTWTTYGVPTTVTRQWQRCGYPSTVLGDDPLGYWRLGDSTGVTPTARDELEQDDGTYSGGPTYGVSGALDGDANSAVDFGAGSFIDLTNPVSFGSSDFTLEAWFKTSSAAAHQQIWESDYTGAPSQQQDVSLALVNGDAQFGVEDQTGASASVTSSSTYNDGAWHYVAAVRSGNTFTLYVDGAAVGSTTQSVGDVDVSGSIPRIGDGQTASSNSHDSYFFGGSLDDVAVYQSALSPSQVTTHYGAGTDITSSCVDIPDASGQTYTLTGDDFGNKLRYEVSESNDDGSSPTYYTGLTGAVTDTAPLTPTAQPVASPIATLTPVLQASASDGDGDPLDYQFQVAKTASPGNPIATSDWLPDTNDWTVPAGVLVNKGSYLFKVRVRDPYQDTAWSSASPGFTISLPMLGTSDYWPMWSHGPLSVNEANGNLVLSLPTPSYPTAAGSLNFSLSYNAQATTSSNGLGTGWTLAAGDGAASPPTQLVDHSKDSTDPSPAAEIDWPDGSSDFYNQVGSSDTYLPDSADGSQLTQNQDGSGWTLLAGDGTTYTFGAESNGISRLSGAEEPATTSGNGTFDYSFDASHRLSSLTFHQQTGDSGETLNFNWNCSGALLCVTGPDSKTWTYTANANNEITGVNDGTRQLLVLTYNASGLPVEIQNADDLDPSHASPGYNGQHSLQLTYSGNQVACVIDGPISGQAASAQPSCAGGGNASESTWSFDYNPSCPSLQAPQAGHSVPQGTAAGCTTVTDPDQQPNGPGITVIYDSGGRPLETDDARLGSGHERITLEQYNEQNQLAWSEDEDGNPTDYSYDPVNNVLTSVTAPRPDSGHSRPVTTYRYDEQTIGSANQAGNPLTGLAGSYWTNANLAGQPVTRENDPDPTSSATTFSLPAPGMTWPPTAVGAGAFSARWTGAIDVPASGDYTFTTVSDGSTRLTIGENDLIENWTSPTSPFDSQPVYLDAGYHKLTLEYAHPSGGSANLTLKWSCADCSPGVSSAAVPLTDLVPDWENQTSVVSPAGRISFQHYLDPASGQPDYSLVKLSDGTNLITSSVYDSLGRVTKQFMPKANASATINSATGDLTTTPDTNYETDYTYYGDGTTAAPPTDCGGGSAVDQYGQLESTATPNGGLHSTVTVYNSAGLPIAGTNGKGISCSVYDGEGRLTSETPHGDQSNPTTYNYDPNGIQLTASNNSGTVTDSYDEAGRLIDTADATGAVATYLYDEDGNQLQRKAATSALGTQYTTAYNYDPADELTSESDPARHTYAFFYDDRGDLRGTQYPNGTFSWVDTNADGWISNQYNRHGTITAATTTAPLDSSPLADFSYSYDQDGKRLGETRISGSTSQSTGYSYDNAGRLDQVTLPNGTCRDYSYDLDSNRSQIHESPTGCNGTFTTTASYSYDPATTPGTDELTSTTVGGNETDYAYTSDGQVSSQGTTSFTWDGFGRLATATVGANTVTYTYDPTGALMTRASSSPSATTNYLLGDLLETGGTGSVTTSYMDGPAGDLASFNGPPTSSSSVSYLYYDAHGNLAAEADSGGTLTGTHTYDPFGGPLDAVPSNTTVHRYTGRWNKQYDTTTGLVLMGARPYDPSTGRFLSVDPVPGGSLNDYDYAAQDPINNYDLNGDCILCSDPFGIVSAAKKAGGFLYANSAAIASFAAMLSFVPGADLVAVGFGALAAYRDRHHPLAMAMDIASAAGTGAAFRLGRLADSLDQAAKDMRYWKYARDLRRAAAVMRRQRGVFRLGAFGSSLFGIFLQ